MTVAGSKVDGLDVKDVLHLIGDRWMVTVVQALADEPRRFSEVERMLGMRSRKMLSQELRTLERDGYVQRTVYGTSPPKVDYRLTELGRELMALIRAASLWCARVEPEVLEARERFEGRSSGMPGLIPVPVAPPQP